MDQTTFKVLDALSREIGRHSSIKGITDKIRELHGTAYYANIYHKVKFLTHEGILDIEKIGAIPTIQLAFNNYLLIDILAEIEIKRKHDLLRKRIELQAPLEEVDIYLRNLPLIGPICMSRPEKNIKLNRLELLIMIRGSPNHLAILGYRNALYEITQMLQRKYNLKIDLMILTNEEFLHFLQSKDRNPLTEMLADKIAFINPQGFWIEIRQAIRRGILIMLQFEETNPTKIAERDIIFNLARFGYKEFGAKINTGESICIEYIIAAMLMSKDARRIEAVPIIIAKNSLNFSVLFFLSQKYGFDDRLLGLLKVLYNIKPSEEIKNNIQILERTQVTEITADEESIQEKMKLYNAT